ncbi:MAG: hypothetical protein ACI95T_000090 [Flavobacteriales bacterium]|jgi:hypothetical protein
MIKDEKKNRKLGLIISGVTHLLVILLLFAFTMDTKKVEKEPVILLMDFTPSGSSSRGGSSASPSESETVSEESQNVVEPVVTQKTESAVKKSDKKASKTSSTTTTEKKANAQASAANAFGGDGSGEGQGSGDGKGNDSGIGENEGNGPGLKGFGKIGSGDGSNPEFKNPTQEQGKVLVKLFVNRKGRVTSVQVLSSRRETTTSDAVLLNKAKRDGLKYMFSANSKREEISIAYRLINYTLQ